MSAMEGAHTGARAFSTSVGRGAFILFEGVDRCGKTTQVGLLNDNLAKSKRVEQIRFPERKSAVGQLIDSYLQSNSNLNDQSIHLLFSANRWEQADSIEAKLAGGCSLVSNKQMTHTFATNLFHLIGVRQIRIQRSGVHQCEGFGA
jgi:thymidylate kinase